MNILWSTARKVDNSIMFDNFASSLIERLWVGHQTKCRIPPQSVSDDQRLTVSVCGRAHRDAVCGFACVLFQIAIELFALFHYSNFHYMCFTVMFQR